MSDIEGTTEIRHSLSCIYNSATNSCTCGLAALEAKAAKWDAMLGQHPEMKAEIDAAYADAAKWRQVVTAGQRVVDAGGASELHIELSGPNVHLLPCGTAEDSADARRWRTVERAVTGDGASFHILATLGGIVYEIDYRRRVFSGPTLAAVVDALAERMDKEAT